MPCPSVYSSGALCLFLGYVCKAAAALLSMAMTLWLCLVCLNPTVAWHPLGTSSAANSPDPQLCGVMTSLISPASLKLAQMYLNYAVILTDPVKYRSISLDIAGGSGEEYSWCLGKDQPWLKPLETAQCWQSQCRVQKLLLLPNCSSPPYIS